MMIARVLGIGVALITSTWAHPLVSPSIPLADAEPVLLVGDDEGQLIVDYLLLYERMGSNNDIRLMGGDFPVSSTLLLCRHGTGYQHDLFVNAIFFEQESMDS